MSRRISKHGQMIEPAPFVDRTTPARYKGIGKAVFASRDSSVLSPPFPAPTPFGPFTRSETAMSSLHLRIADSVRCLVVLAAAWLAAVDAQAVEPPREDSIAQRVGGRADGPVDIAAFGQIVTSDPKRMTGTAANRIQEFPAADIALETELRPAADGSYAVPASGDRPGCIGLRWCEMRFLRRLELHWGKGVTPPPADAVKLQYWVGESPWQGQWTPLPAKFNSAVRRFELANRRQGSARRHGPGALGLPRLEGAARRQSHIGLQPRRMEDGELARGVEAIIGGQGYPCCRLQRRSPVRCKETLRIRGG